MRRSVAWACGVLAVVATLCAGGSLALDPATKCQANKNKVAGKYAFCRQKAEMVALKKGLPPDYSKCDEKFFDKWAKAEEKAVGTCPDEPLDPNTLADFIKAHCDAVATALAGGPLPTCAYSTCGDGVLDPNEDCDFGDLGGATCVSLGFGGGTLTCGAFCRFDGSQCLGSCLEDRDCPASRYCGGDGLCHDGCRVDPDSCPPDYYCDAATHDCVMLAPSCTGDLDCPASQYCGGDGLCHDGCRVEPDSCVLGVCDPGTHECVVA